MKPFLDEEERRGYLGLNSLLLLCHEHKASVFNFTTLDHSQTGIKRSLFNQRDIESNSHQEFNPKSVSNYLKNILLPFKAYPK